MLVLLMLKLQWIYTHSPPRQSNKDSNQSLRFLECEQVQSKSYKHCMHVWYYGNKFILFLSLFYNSKFEQYLSLVYIANVNVYSMLVQH